VSIEISKKLWEISLNTNTDELDQKHVSIISSAKKNSFNKVKRNYRSWEMQSDHEVPFQFNFFSLRSYGLTKYLRYLLATLKNDFIYGTNKCSSFFDDIEIIKLLNGFDILEKCPVHKSPGNTIAFFLNKNISANLRWLRYIYFASILRKYCHFENKSPIILDIGSYYGGFQYVTKNIFSNSKHILVDFPHQLARSALFLGESFPNAKIYSIHDNNSLNEFFHNESIQDYDFLLLTTDYYHKFSDIYSFSDLDLLTNFYSLGEMTKNDFKKYLNSKILINAKQIYFCNRFDSSPFYEPTYESKLSILDYLVDGFNIELSQSSGIHNYIMTPRKLFGKKKVRPTSSRYFDLILKK
tara:strand:- start:91 stop:1152 length:1062 start_codon:yes stop_codon:yes gene_type:complete